jgi:hypothetical protein
MTFAHLRSLGFAIAAVILSLHLGGAHAEEPTVNIDNFTFEP